MTINWQTLKALAKQGFDNAYAPYSKFPVGSAAISEDGKTYFGCNVENASYGLTVCAERNCIAQAVIDGTQKIQAVVVYTEEETLTPPCGACRQVIAEFMPQTGIVKAMNHLGDEKSWTIQELLPDAFTPQNLL